MTSSPATSPPAGDPATEPPVVSHRWWRRAGPYVLAGGWYLVVAASLLFVGWWTPISGTAAIWMFVLDLVLGAAALALLFFRRRWPVTVTVTLTVVSSVVASSAGGAMLVALVSYAARPYERRHRVRRYAFFTGLTVVSVVGSLAYDWASRSVVTPALAPEIAEQGPQRPLESLWALASSIGVAVLVVGFCLAVGSYMGARRALLLELHDRARRAESVVEATGQRARTAERNRIAREMHDVLAHRISLVALHSGALSHRTDLPPEAVRDAAEVISSNAHLALTELRQVLGVLRADDSDPDAAAGHREPPQPTMTAVDGLITDARQVGGRVRLTVIGIGSLRGATLQALTAGTGVDDVLATLSPTVSRTAYRILQEALTNARKHAPDAVVDVELSGRLGRVLTLSVTNPMPFGEEGTAHEDGHSLGGILGSGSGLTGLAERTDLAGGTLDHGVEPDGFGRTVFAVRAWLPWDENVGGWRGRGGG